MRVFSWLSRPGASKEGVLWAKERESKVQVMRLWGSKGCGAKKKGWESQRTSRVERKLNQMFLCADFATFAWTCK